MTLEAIKYKRGQLELLDQRVLPIKSVYLEINNTKDAWKAINDMIIRGAPAISIAAILSLAIELDNIKFNSIDDCWNHIQSKLDYLITSRPTAVNIEDASIKIKKLCTQLKTDPDITLEKFILNTIEYCEKMLEDDLSYNKKIGLHGSELIMNLTGKEKDLRILTHCNTGSLATAGYGTALGIVRSLHEKQALNKIYCTETRPHNQGSRLTAYEIVSDKMPGTLICDSAAASLIKSKEIDAIVVGADRVAANGDTANKIGTLSLAIIAHQYNVPFIVAAPTTSLDLTLDDGNQIEIEMRNSDEIKKIKGILMAPEEIEAWNPAFDVTPASMISGIVIEEGAILPLNNNTYKLKNQLEKNDLNGCNECKNGISQNGFYVLTEQNIKEYIKSKEELIDKIGSLDTIKDWKIREVGDGNINYVYIIEGPKGSLLIKQELDYIRVVKDWKLTKDRVRVEAMSLKKAFAYCPEHVPEVFLYDSDMSLIVMRYIEEPHIIMRKGNISGILYSKIAEQLATYLSKTLFYTSLLYLNATEFKNEMIKFNNPEMCKITEQLIFGDAYYDAPMNKIPNELESEVKILHTDDTIKNIIFDLRLKFMSSPEALLHGDLHCGNLMVTETSMFAIDFEFAFYGPMGFDIGKIMGNFLLAYFSLDGHATHDNPRTEQRLLLLNSTKEIWEKFSVNFLKLWNDNPGIGDGCPSCLLECPSTLNVFQNSYMKRLLSDSLAYCCACIIRRIVTMAKVAEMEEIKIHECKVVCLERALKFARKLLIKTDSLSIDDVIKMAIDMRLDGKKPFFD